MIVKIKGVRTIGEVERPSKVYFTDEDLLPTG
jgi:hypothetical protein